MNPEPAEDETRTEPRHAERQFPWTEPLTLASELPEWDLLPPTEFVQRPRGRL